MKDRDTFKIGNAVAVQYMSFRTGIQYLGIIEEILPEGICREMVFRLVLCNGMHVIAYESELKHLKR